MERVLPGCFTCGDSLAAVIEQAPNVLGDVLYAAERDRCPVPAPTPQTEVKVGDGDLCQLVAVYMPPVRRAWSKKAVRKTLTIPSYLADLAEEANINYSAVLQHALKQELRVQ